MALVTKIDLDGKVTHVDEDLEDFTLDSETPKIVTRRQARRALLNAGLLSQVDSAIDAIPDEMTRESMRIDWQDATEFKRDDATLIALASALGLSEAQLDDLFISAAQI